MSCSFRYPRLLLALPSGWHLPRPQREQLPGAGAVHVCTQEMPASTVLKKQFEGRDVVFVYISVGDKADKWQKTLAAEHLTSPASVHLRSTEQDDVPSRYQVDAFSTYWLIGRNGRIVTGSAPRPSAGAATVAAIATELTK